MATKDSRPGSPSALDPMAAAGDGRKALFVTAVSGWSGTERSCSALSLLPNAPRAWRNDDPEFAESWRELDACEELRVVETARRRGLDGDGPLLRAYLRLVRGIARPVEVSTAQRDPDLLPPAVAAAMIEAGLAAMGELPVDVPAPVIKTAGQNFYSPALPVPGAPTDSRSRPEKNV